MRKTGRGAGGGAKSEKGGRVPYNVSARSNSEKGSKRERCFPLLWIQQGYKRTREHETLAGITPNERKKGRAGEE